VRITEDTITQKPHPSKEFVNRGHKKQGDLTLRQQQPECQKIIYTLKARNRMVGGGEALGSFW